LFLLEEKVHFRENNRETKKQDCMHSKSFGFLH
jgi:hypothetical protein